LTEDGVRRHFVHGRKLFGRTSNGRLTLLDSVDASVQSVDAFVHGTELSFAKKRNLMEFFVIAGHVGLMEGDPLERHLLVGLLGCVSLVK
jgi:hypothetical protein